MVTSPSHHHQPEYDGTVLRSRLTGRNSEVTRCVTPATSMAGQCLTDRLVRAG